MNERVPPDFIFNAGRFAEVRKLSQFIVYDESPQAKDEIVWKIIADEPVDYSKRSSPVITYGKVPPGFRQEAPAAGDAPPLLEGRLYLAVGGDPSFVPWTHVQFTIRDGKIVSVPNAHR